MDKTEPQTLTVSQCAQIAGKHRRTILNWIHQNLLPAYRQGPRVSGPYLVSKDDLMEAIKKVKVNGDQGKEPGVHDQPPVAEPPLR